MRFIRLLCLCIAAALLLSGCFYSGIFDMVTGGSIFQAVGFQDMSYTRPDIDALRNAFTSGCEALKTTNSFEEVAQIVVELNALYSDYLTNYQLSNIHYSCNLKDIYWEEEYNYCLGAMPSVEQALEQLYHTLARSPYREDLESEEYFGADFFDAYDGDILYDAHFLSLTEKEAELESRYYALSESADPYAPDYFNTNAAEMAQLYAELVSLRQEIAQYAGYESYAQYSYETHYGRDYTPEEAEAYLQAMGEALLPLFRELYLADDWGYSYEYCTESGAFGYVKNAASAMGGTIAEAFRWLEEYQLYDLRYSTDKYNASFEVFLPSYGQPFIFMNPSLDQSDKLTFAHEFGHFTNDYVCGGSYAGIDVAEVHSQSFEYLSLCYGEASQELKNYKMVDSLFAFIQCAAHALFELRVYQLPADKLTAENILALYEEVTTGFGFDLLDWDSRNYVQITHFFTHPMYMVSYVISNDLAMQIYQLELEQPGEGLALYTRCLESNESQVLQFAAEYGLESPLIPQRPRQLALFFRDAFQSIFSRTAVAA